MRESEFDEDLQKTNKPQLTNNTIEDTSFLLSKIGRHGYMPSHTWVLYAHCTLSHSSCQPSLPVWVTKVHKLRYVSQPLISLSNNIQLLTVPPYAVAAVLTITVGWIADRTRWRGYLNMGCALCAMTGFAMLLGSRNIHIQYAGTFLGAAGIYPAVPNTVSW